uniref:Uncharacterized protein n=1 Tax=Chromera velia CCMP2878 TaxID=1169474 RepID=A0A0G4GAD6_9ALVE|eukprot:Cvel_20902.t1-p1 / transcript=Cvel_20902.t1 / gene=Cvel_20902 / organism=Chromera_velia_CCMP2878 / gene_product=hypothetical protein / transcript_product=hypothetical protein / location=Cvel_scaffold1917:20047-33389(-) / protein_length=2666 / sequence_SO=supercontig / SO=protein_coding / is_pseudo=false
MTSRLGSPQCRSFLGVLCMCLAMFFCSADFQVRQHDLQGGSNTAPADTFQEREDRNARVLSQSDGLFAHRAHVQSLLGDEEGELEISVDLSSRTLSTDVLVSVFYKLKEHDSQDGTKKALEKLTVVLPPGFSLPMREPMNATEVGCNVEEADGLESEVPSVFSGGSVETESARQHSVRSRGETGRQAAEWDDESEPPLSFFMNTQTFPSQQQEEEEGRHPLPFELRDRKHLLMEVDHAAQVYGLQRNQRGATATEALQRGAQKAMKRKGKKRAGEKKKKAEVQRIHLQCGVMPPSSPLSAACQTRMESEVGQCGSTQMCRDGSCGPLHLCSSSETPVLVPWERGDRAQLVAVALPAGTRLPYSGGVLQFWARTGGDLLAAEDPSTAWLVGAEVSIKGGGAVRSDSFGENGVRGDNESRLELCQTHQAPWLHPSPGMPGGSRCEYEAWKVASPCSADCDGGMQLMTRRLIRGGPACTRLRTWIPCNGQPCARDCVLEEYWQEALSCSSVCEAGRSGGVAVDVRRVVVPPAGGGRSCVEVAGEWWDEEMGLALRRRDCASRFMESCYMKDSDLEGERAYVREGGNQRRRGALGCVDRNAFEVDEPRGFPWGVCPEPCNGSREQASLRFLVRQRKGVVLRQPGGEAEGCEGTECEPQPTESDECEAHPQDRRLSGGKGGAAFLEAPCQEQVQCGNFRVFFEHLWVGLQSSVWIVFQFNFLQGAGGADTIRVQLHAPTGYLFGSASSDCPVSLVRESNLGSLTSCRILSNPNEVSLTFSPLPSLTTKYRSTDSTTTTRYTPKASDGSTPPANATATTTLLQSTPSPPSGKREAIAASLAFQNSPEGTFFGRIWLGVTNPAEEIVREGQARHEPSVWMVRFAEGNGKLSDPLKQVVTPDDNPWNPEAEKDVQDRGRDGKTVACGLTRAPACRVCDSEGPKDTTEPEDPPQDKERKTGYEWHAAVETERCLQVASIRSAKETETGFCSQLCEVSPSDQKGSEDEAEVPDPQMYPIPNLLDEIRRVAVNTIQLGADEGFFKLTPLGLKRDLTVDDLKHRRIDKMTIEMRLQRPFPENVKGKRKSEDALMQEQRGFQKQCKCTFAKNGKGLPLCALCSSAFWGEASSHAATWMLKSKVNPTLLSVSIDAQFDMTGKLLMQMIDDPRPRPPHVSNPCYCGCDGGQPCAASYFPLLIRKTGAEGEVARDQIVFKVPNPKPCPSLKALVSKGEGGKSIEDKVEGALLEMDSCRAFAAQRLAKNIIQWLKKAAAGEAAGEEISLDDLTLRRLLHFHRTQGFMSVEDLDDLWRVLPVPPPHWQHLDTDPKENVQERMGGLLKFASLQKRGEGKGKRKGKVAEQQQAGKSWGLDFLVHRQESGGVKKSEKGVLAEPRHADKRSLDGTTLSSSPVEPAGSSQNQNTIWVSFSTSLPPPSQKEKGKESEENYKHTPQTTVESTADSNSSPKHTSILYPPKRKTDSGDQKLTEDESNEKEDLYTIPQEPDPKKIPTLRRLGGPLGNPPLPAQASNPVPSGGSSAHPPVPVPSSCLSAHPPAHANVDADSKKPGMCAATHPSPFSFSTTSAPLPSLFNSVPNTFNSKPQQQQQQQVSLSDANSHSDPTKSAIHPPSTPLFANNFMEKIQPSKKLIADQCKTCKCKSCRSVPRLSELVNQVMEAVEKAQNSNTNPRDPPPCSPSSSPVLSIQFGPPLPADTDLGSLIKKEKERIRGQLKQKEEANKTSVLYPNQNKQTAKLPSVLYPNQNKQTAKLPSVLYPNQNEETGMCRGETEEVKGGEGGERSDKNRQWEGNQEKGQQLKGLDTQDFSSFKQIKETKEKGGGESKPLILGAGFVMHPSTSDPRAKEAEKNEREVRLYRNSRVKKGTTRPRKPVPCATGFKQELPPLNLEKVASAFPLPPSVETTCAAAIKPPPSDAPLVFSPLFGKTDQTAPAEDAPSVKPPTPDRPFIFSSLFAKTENPSPADTVPMSGTSPLVFSPQYLKKEQHGPGAASETTDIPVSQAYPAPPTIFSMNFGQNTAAQKNTENTSSSGFLPTAAQRRPWTRRSRPGGSTGKGTTLSPWSLFAPSEAPGEAPQAQLPLGMFAGPLTGQVENSNQPIPGGGDVERDVDVVHLWMSGNIPGNSKYKGGDVDGGKEGGEGGGKGEQKDSLCSPLFPPECFPAAAAESRKLMPGEGKDPAIAFGLTKDGSCGPLSLSRTNPCPLDFFKPPEVTIPKFFFGDDRPTGDGKERPSSAEGGKRVRHANNVGRVPAGVVGGGSRAPGGNACPPASVAVLPQNSRTRGAAATAERFERDRERLQRKRLERLVKAKRAEAEEAEAKTNAENKEKEKQGGGNPVEGQNKGGEKEKAKLTKAQKRRAAAAAAVAAAKKQLADQQQQGKDEKGSNEETKKSPSLPHVSPTQVDEDKEKKKDTPSRKSKKKTAAAQNDEKAAAANKRMPKETPNDHPCQTPNKLKSNTSKVPSAVPADADCRTAVPEDSPSTHTNLSQTHGAGKECGFFCGCQPTHPGSPISSPVSCLGGDSQKPALSSLPPFPLKWDSQEKPPKTAVKGQKQKQTAASSKHVQIQECGTEEDGKDNTTSQNENHTDNMVDMWESTMRELRGLTEALAAAFERECAWVKEQEKKGEEAARQAACVDKEKRQETEKTGKKEKAEKKGRVKSIEY